MSPQQTLILHERLGRWSRQLRPRYAGRPVRVVETRSAEELAAAAASSVFAVVLLDVSGRPEAALEALEAGSTATRDGLFLVLDPDATPGLPPLARELGATLVVSEPATPPRVVTLLDRFLRVSDRRAAHAGWLLARPEPGPLDDLHDVDGIYR